MIERAGSNGERVRGCHIALRCAAVIASCGAGLVVTETPASALAPSTVELLQSAFPVALAPSNPLDFAGQAIDPQLAASSPIDGFVLSGGFAAATVPADPARGFTVGAGPDMLLVTAQDVPSGAGRAQLIADTAAVYAGTGPSADTVLRATAVGVEALTLLRDASAPDSFSWRVALRADQRLVRMPDGAVAVLEPAGNDPVESVSAGDPAALLLATTDPRRQLADAQNAFLAASAQTAGRVDAVVEAPSAVDAAGNSIAASLRVQGDIVTLDVDRSGDVHYPVLADPTFVTAAAAQPSPPAPSTSFYVGQPTPALAFARGKEVARAASSRNASLYIVHFGTQRTGSGATVTPGGVAASYATIVKAAKAFVGGMQAGSATKSMRIVLATNNSGPVGKSVTQYALRGTQWARDVTLPVYEFVRANRAYASHISVSGGSDIETGFGPPAPALAWETAFAAASLANRVKLYIDGDAGGCPESAPATTAPPGVCNGGWTQNTVYRANWEPDPASTPIVRPVPQIYTDTTVQIRQDLEWRALSQFGSRRSPNGRIIFSGTLTQCQARQYKIIDEHLPATGTLGPHLANKPNTGWSLLAGDVQGNSQTRLTIPPAMPYSSDVSWEWMRPNRYAARCGLQG